QGRLAKLTQPARQLVRASAVLGTQVSAPRLWQVTEIGVQTGVEALEEAVGSGMLREEGAGAGQAGTYRFAHERIRDVVYTHLGQAHAFQNAWEKAQQAYEELLAYAQHQRQFTLVSMTLNRLAILAVQQPHDKPQVQALLEQAWHMAQSSSDQKALAETEWNRAQIIGVVWEDPKQA